MLKNNLMAGDILVLANGDKREFGKTINWLLNEYYTEDLKCKTDSTYDIVQVLRPVYEEIYNREKEEGKSVCKGR